MMRHMLSILGLSALLLSACQSPTFMPQPTPNTSLTSQSLVRSEVEINFTYSADKTELTCKIKESTTTTVYTTLRRPLTGNQVVAETSVFQNNQLLKKGPSTPADAKLVTQAAASNGLADIYKDLKERYRLAGLAR